MSLTTRGWVAQQDLMPVSATFRTYGTVTVAHSGITPRLTKSSQQPNPSTLRLDLTLEHTEQNALLVEVDKTVEFRQSGDLKLTAVSIFYEGNLLVHLDDIQVTH